MARIFSWHIQDESKECFAYLAQSGSQGTYVTGSMVLDDKITNSTTLNKIADVVSGYSETNYRNQFNAMKTKVAQKGFTVQWMDYSYYYDVDGNNLIMLTGIGQIGPQGPQGVQGQKGETGSSGKGRNIMCYCGLDSGITPTTANLVGGKFYPNKWEIEYPYDPSGVCVWQDSNEFGLGKVVWMSNADFPSSTGDSLNEYVTPIVKTDKSGNTYTWAPPMQISGPKGDNGADGERIEFVYKRCHTRKDPVPDTPTGNTEAEALAQGWTDHPQGLVGDSDNPKENWKIEYMSQHVKDDEGVWGTFSAPIIWASWGEDGNDGDGVEYIFAVTDVYDNDEITRTLPNSGMTLALTNGGELRLADIWQEPEVYDYFSYCGVTKTNDGISVDPDGRYFYGKTGATDTRHASVYPWTDDPMDVSADEPYEWMSMRRSSSIKYSEEGPSKHNDFGPFCDPKLWAHWGKDGEKGNDGTSVDIRGQEDTLGILLKKLGNKVPEVGFSYAIGKEGKRVYVWMEQDSSFNLNRDLYLPGQMPEDWYNNSDEIIYNGYCYQKDNKNYWFTDCGSFYGEPGKNAYVHEKYAKDYYSGQTGVDHRIVTVVFPEGPKQVDICFTSRSGETPGKYFATYTDNNPDDRGDLDFYDGKWVKWMGDDGQSYGQEQIFFRCQSLIDINNYTTTATENAHGYEIGEKYLNVTYTPEAFTTNDWTPNGWTDVPLGVEPGLYNFIYVSIRRLVQDGSVYDGTWSYFSEPALYAEAVDTLTFQVEYTKWSGTTKPQLTSANEFTSGGTFDEGAWRINEAAKPTHIQWSDENDVDTTWMAQCNGYYVNGDKTKLKWNDWIITRCKGFDGKAGTGRNIQAYCSLPPGYKPTVENVSGGLFYPNIWDISFPIDTVGVNPQGASGPTLYCSWQDSNEPADPSFMVWMTNADFPNSTGTTTGESVSPIVKVNSTGGTYTWTTPVCITGEKGDNGADGESVEFIYFRTSGDTKPDRPLGEEDPHYQEPDFLPYAYINGVFTGEKWTDHPDGITYEMPFEWMSMRTRGDNGLWGSFSDVSAWSRWGEDGVDGDGVEYIFATGETANDAQALYETVPKVGKKYALSGGGEVKITEEIWQEPEIYDFFSACGITRTDDGIAVNPTGKFFYGKTGVTDTEHDSLFPWTDDASDVSPDEPFEYVSIRRRKYTKWTEPSGKVIEKALYYDFEEPVMWARWSEDGDEVHTSFAFTVRREGDDISKCTVSGFTPDLVPKKTFSGGTEIQMTWTDAPEPWGEATIAASGAPIIWMTSGIFRKHHNAKTGVNTWSQESNWGPITRMVDTDNFEVMYSPGKPIPGGYDPNDVETLPTGFTKIGVTINPTWLRNAKNAGWYDEAEQLPQLATWMATNMGSNNKFSDNGWKYIKIKGEKGDSGATGVSKFKSIIFQRSNTTPDRPTGGNYLSPLPDPIGDWQDTVPQGSAKLWMSSRTFSSDGADAQYWDVPSQCTDTEYIDYEWTNRWKTMEEAENYRPLKSSPNQSITPAQNNQWYDEPISGATFMAIKEVSNGAYVNAAQTAWTVSQIKGEKGEYPDDLNYLMDVFGKKNVDQGNGAVLREFLGVTDDGSASSNVVAFMNGSSGTNNTFVDSTDGKLMIAAGIEGGLAYAKSAKFRVFSNGKIYAEAADISGTINADSGTFKGRIEADSGNIGGIEINNGLSSQNFSVDSNGNLIVSSIKINTKNFSLGDNIYNTVSEFTGATGTSVNTVATNIDIWSGNTRLSTYQQQYLVAPTSSTKTLLSYSVNAKQSVTVKIDYEYEYAVEFQNTQLQDYEYIRPSANIFINLDITDNNVDVGSLHAYTDLTLSDITKNTGGGSSSAITGSTTFKITQDIGNHTLKIGVDENFDAVGYYGSNAGSNFTWRISKFSFKVTKIKVDGIITNEGTEIFQNGFGLKSNANNYFFVNRTTGSTNFEVKSNGSGITLDNNGFHIDSRFSNYQNIRSGGDITLNMNDDIIMYNGDGRTITIPNHSNIPIGKTFKLFNYIGNNMKICAATNTNAIFKPRGGSSSSCGVIVGGQTFSEPSQRWIYDITRIPTTRVSGLDPNGTQRNVECYWLILES